MPDWLRRHRGLVPYLFLIPGGLWLIVFYVIPVLTTASVALQEGTLGTGFRLTFNFGVFPQAIGQYDTQLVRSLQFGLIVTILTLLIGYPMAYTIAFRGGRYKNVLLLLVIMPFFTSFIIRTISWKFILADQGFVLGTLKDAGIVEQSFRLLATPVAVISGITYNFLPFVVLPLYVALEKIDPRLVEAATDLYASRAQAFLRVTLPLSISGVFAGSLLAFIPAAGDYINAELLGNPQTQMIGNVIQNLFEGGSYPEAAALSVTLMSVIVLMVLLYIRRAGTEELL